jgi:hypothetical protein
MQTTQRLKSELWSRYGSEQHPAEWDGRVYGGGKLSQRFWEYFKAIELLDLTPESVVLDIGGGSPTSGAGFFAALLAGVVRRVLILDPEVPAAVDAGPNITLIREAASHAVLLRLLREHPEVTHIASISVFEHVAPAVREGVVQAINEAFTGPAFVATFEYHPRRVYFEHQLTARSVSALFHSLTRYYLDEFVASPVWCVNAFDRKRIVRLGRNDPYTAPNFSAANIPLWHPVAVRFLRQPGAADQRRPSAP